jgi:dihydroorotate dehydrogenase electron transfer subunit
VNNYQSYQSFRLAQVKKENSVTNTLVFDLPVVNAQPGQFVMAWLPGIGEKPYSIFGREPFSLAVTNVGPFSSALYNLTIGKRVWIRGPLGQGFRLIGSSHLLAGGGYGAAPLLFLASEARRRKDQVKVCLGARSAGEVLLAEAFKELGCDVFITTDDGSLGEKGLVTQAVESVLKSFEVDSLYACGPVPMLSALVKLCIEQKITSQLSWEAQMRCGIGLCGSCELDDEIRKSAGMPMGWLTCKDGPVFIKSL